MCPRVALHPHLPLRPPRTPSLRPWVASCSSARLANPCRRHPPLSCAGGTPLCVVPSTTSVLCFCLRRHQLYAHATHSCTSCTHTGATPLPMNLPSMNLPPMNPTLYPCIHKPWTALMCVCGCVRGCVCVCGCGCGVVLPVLSHPSMCSATHRCVQPPIDVLSHPSIAARHVPVGCCCSWPTGPVRCWST